MGSATTTAGFIRCFGRSARREVEPDGKTVVIDSDETARAVDFCRKFFQQTMFEDVLGWTDVSNNKAWMSEQISCTNNAESILWFAKKQFPDIAKVTEQSLNPKGPKGRFHILGPWNHAIYSFSPNQQAAKDFLVWLMDPKQIGRWYASADSYYAPFVHAYDDAPFWHVEPRNLPYRDSLDDFASARLAGAYRPAAVGECGEIRGRGHVRQGLHRQVHQGGHRRRQSAASADLQAGLMASAHTEALARPAFRPPRRAFSLRRWTEREGVFSWLMVIPPVLFLVALVGYPFVYGIWLSLEDRPVAKAGVFIGLGNFITDLHDPVFWQVAQKHVRLYVRGDRAEDGRAAWPWLW